MKNNLQKPFAVPAAPGDNDGPLGPVPPGKLRITVHVNDTELNSFKVIQHLNDVYGDVKPEVEMIDTARQPTIRGMGRVSNQEVRSDCYNPSSSGMASSMSTHAPGRLTTESVNSYPSDIPTIREKLPS